MANIKTKLSAAMVGLIAAGASAPVMMAQFQSEKEGTSLTAYADRGGVWTICGGVTRVYGRKVVKGLKLTRTQCDTIDKIEQAKALAWVDKNIHIPLTDPQKSRYCVVLSVEHRPWQMLPFNVLPKN